MSIGVKNLKKFLKICLSIFILATSLVVAYLHMTEIAPHQLRVRYESISSSEIPADLDGIKIVFFSDVHFNGFVDDVRFENLINAINNQYSDVVLFGGDLFDHPANRIPDEATIEKATEFLSRINAPLGKFAVLGNHDLESNDARDKIKAILEEADFELITNRNIRLRNHGFGSIALVGIDSEMLGYPDLEAALADIQPSDFTLAICHTPDTVLKVPDAMVDLFLAGHGHGGQVYFPIFGAYYKAKYAEEHYRGKHRIGGILLDVTNGVGTTKMDIRFLASAEIVVYTLHSQPTP